SLSLFLSLLDILFAHVATIGNSNLLFFTGTLILSSNVQNTVGIEVKGNFNLWHTTWSWINPVKYEPTQALIISGHFTLTLKYVDLNLWLVICSGRESLRLRSRDGCIALD